MVSPPCSPTSLPAPLPLPVTEPITNRAMPPGDTGPFITPLDDLSTLDVSDHANSGPTATLTPAQIETIETFNRLFGAYAADPSLTPSDNETTPNTSTHTPIDTHFSLSSMSTMTDSHSSSNSPTDFAFAAPSLPNGHGGMSEMKPFSSNMSPPSAPNYGAYHHNPFHYADGSSFSSSGSATGSSFSSADALPAISRNFAPPSTSDTRRPATSAGAPTSRPFGHGGLEPSIPEEGENGNMQQHDINAMNAAAARRASESQVPWNNFQFSGMQMLQQQQQQQANAYNRATMAQARPQTSDGVPMTSFAPSLPSASSITGHLDYRLPYARMPEPAHSTFPGDRSYSMSNGVRPSYITPPTSSSGTNMGTTVAEDGSLQFVSLGGPASKKRPRRRFDEIERLYLCGWNGCEKSYGTLNHLNAHVAMQKHGEKRLPTGESSFFPNNSPVPGPAADDIAEFKEMRKQWRKKKREQTAAVANSQSMQMHAWGRASLSSSSGSEFDRRESSISLVPSEFSGAGRNSSVYSNSTYGGFNDSRPGTAGSMASTDSRPGTGYSAVNGAGGPSSAPMWGYGPGPSVMNGGACAGGARRVSAPMHIPMPPTIPENGFRPVEGDHPTPTPQNPFPLAPQQQMNGSSNSNPNGGRQYFQQQTLTTPMSQHLTQQQQQQQQQQLSSGFDQFAFR